MNMNNKSISKLFMSNTAAYIVILFLISLLPLLTENNLIAAGTGFAVWVAVTIYSFVHEKKAAMPPFQGTHATGFPTAGQSTGLSCLPS